MKKRNNPVCVLISACFMLILICNSKIAFQGISEGIDLCLRTIIPSLFPLAILSNILTAQLNNSGGAFLRMVGKLFKLPQGYEGILVPGLLGGYPLGAAAIANAYNQHQINKPQAHRLLMFCCNAGPSFIFGLAGSLFSNSLCSWALWTIQIASALVISRLIPSDLESSNYASRKASSCGLSDSVGRATHSMASVCAWITLFRMVIRFLEEWSFGCLPALVRLLLYGILEISNGCISLNQIPSEPLKFVICSGFLGFGGLCVAMQTASVASNLELKHYLAGKALQSVLCVAFSILMLPYLFEIPFSWKFLVLVLAVPALFLLRIIPENYSRNLISSDV